MRRSLLSLQKRIHTKSATQLYLYFYELIEGFDSGEGWKKFMSETIDSPVLEAVRLKASLVTLPLDEKGMTVLRNLMSDIKTLVDRENQNDETLLGNVEYIQLQPNASPRTLTRIGVKNRPFSAVVIIDTEVTPEWRYDVSKWLIEQGCLCMMAWGKDCSLWDDSVDMAHLEAHNWEDIPDGQSVMTTWHEKEPLSDVFWNANLSNFHPPDSSLDHIIILDITDAHREHKIRDLFAKACRKID